MKYTLLGTTALVAAGLVAGQAYAAEGGVKLGLGGFYEGAYGSHFDTEDSGTGGVEDAGLDRGDALGQQIEIHFNGKATLDNGISFGVRVELEGQTQGDQIDAAYAYVQGGFGDFTIGDRGDALGTMCYIIPRAAHIFGAESADFTFDNSGVNGYGRTNGTCYGIADKSTELMYISPNFGGFTFAASYKPDGTEDTTGTHPGGFGTTSDSDTPFQDSEDYSVAAQFDRDFNGVHVIVGGGASFVGDVEGSGAVKDPDGREDYQAYATVGFGLGDGTLTVGGSYGLRVNIRTVTTVLGIVADVNTGDNEIWGAGITYNLDAWTVGLGFTEGSYESSCGDGAGACDDTHDVASLDASYAIGPGVAVEGTIGWYDYDSGNGTDADDLTAITGGAGIWIGF